MFEYKVGESWLTLRGRDGTYFVPMSNIAFVTEFRDSSGVNCDVHFKHATKDHVRVPGMTISKLVELMSAGKG